MKFVFKLPSDVNKMLETDNFSFFSNQDLDVNIYKNAIHFGLKLDRKLVG